MSEPIAAGTRFPFINLEKAIARAKQLFDQDHKGRDMAISGAFAVWEYSEKSSGGFQTIAALKMYGLVKDTAGGDTRKIALTDTALRYFRDEREDEKKKLAREFALKPKLIASLWAVWRATPPADTVARSHLKAERGLNDQGSRSLLSIYKENLAFAELKGSDMIPEPGVGDGYTGALNDDDPPPPPPPGGKARVKVMDGERVVFTEEGQPLHYLKLIASGEVDDSLLEALEDFVKRQRKRLKAADSSPKGAN